MSVIKQKLGWKVTIGGDQHRGWIPRGATEPLPEPAREVSLDVRIEKDPGGFLLITSSTDKSISGDTWHETLESAERAALQRLGISSADWETTNVSWPDG
jgi:hypothetical protein